MQTLLQDMRYAIRVLAKKPTFVAIAVLTLALGIGASTAIFSVINGVLLKPFSYAEPDQLVVAWERAMNQGIARMVVSPPNFSDWRSQNHLFQDMAAYRQQDFSLIDGEPQQVRGLRVTTNMLSLLGVRPLLGRDFQVDEDKPGTPAAVIVSYGFWQRQFGGDVAIIGRSIRLGNETATVIGVMPRDFDFPPPISFRGEARPIKVELWTQLPYAAQVNQRGAHNLFVLGRLKPGISIEQAEADLRSISQRLAIEYPETNAGWDAALVPLHQQVVGDSKTALLILPGAVLFVLLIACANVANLLLVRASMRQREFAIRASLGAGRFRLIRQILFESIFLSLLAGITGLVLAIWALKLITALAPQNIYRLDAVTLDARVILFALFVTLVTAFLSSLAPAWQHTRINLVTTLKEGSATVSDGVAGHRLRNVLVVSEVALALLLLTAAGLLIRSFIRLQTVPTGFQPEQVTAMTINLPRNVYTQPQQRLAFTERLLPKLTGFPMLQSVAFADNLPLDVGGQGTEFKVEGQIVTPGNQPHTRVTTISPAYFQVMGIPMLAGRDFNTSDVAKAPLAVIINNTLATKYFPNQDPVGKRLEMGFFSAGTFLNVVGVVADERQDLLQADPSPTMYLAYAQAPSTLPLILLVRSANDPASITSVVRQQVREVDSQLPVYDVKTMNQVVYRAMARPRFTTFLLAVFAGVAVLLAAIGIYGVMAYTVTNHTREIGIRMAVGAQQSDVIKLIMRQGLVLTVFGVGIGMVAAFGLMRVLSTLLFGVTPTDLVTFVLVPLLFLVVAAVACYIPARRATKVDPLVALRYE